METPLAERIAADPNYQLLKSKRSRFGWTLTLAMMIVYYGFILLIAFKKGPTGGPDRGRGHDLGNSRSGSA